MPVLAEPDIDGEDGDQDCAHGELHEIAAQAGVQQDIVENIDREEADQRRDDGAASGDESAEPDHQRRQCEKNSMPIPVSEPTLFWRAAKRKPARPTSRPASV